ncbi:MAG: 7TM domain-containing protein [Candidatus Peregrinibacteria bacterium]
MKKIFISFLLSLFFIPSVSLAVTFDVNQLRAVIGGNNIVQVKKNIIFDASQSFIPNKEEPVSYRWDLGDGMVAVTEEVVHMYKKPGQYEVILTIRQGDQEDTARWEVFAYEKLVLLLTDVTEKKETITNFVQNAQNEGIFIKLIESFDSTTAFVSEESLSKKLADAVDSLNNADYIAIWTTRGSGINTLTRLVRERPDIQKPIHEKTIVVISEERLGTLGHIMQSNFTIIQPQRIILTRQHELQNLITADSADAFLEHLEKGISEYKVVDAETGRVRLWNLISYLVNFMIVNGIPSNTIVLILMLPLIATIVTFMKQVIGVTTFGLYTPSIITLSFLALGLKFGLTILILIIISGAVLRRALDRFRLLHTPRIGIILTLSTLVILLMLALGTYLDISQIASIAVFPMLIMTTLAEKFVSAMSDKGFYAAMLLMLETTVVSLICYWAVEWQYMQNLVLGHPEIILLFLVINVLLGRWTGLRALEYVRFREVMKHAEE